MKKILKLALTDFKLIFRDPSLYAFLLLPVILYALLIWFVPGLVERYDLLLPYLPLFLVIGVIENTQVFSFISSMHTADKTEHLSVLDYADHQKKRKVGEKQIIPFHKAGDEPYQQRVEYDRQQEKGIERRVTKD